jgi:hypothetical protein
MKKFYSVLEGKVAARNYLHKLAHEAWPMLVAVFTPLIGQRITKSDGNVLAKVNTILPQFEDPEWNLRATYRFGKYSFKLDLCVCFEAQGEVGCKYEECTIYIGDFAHQGGHLEKLYSDFAGRTDYTVSEIAEKRKEYQAAQKRADELKSALHLFGITDRG